VDPELPASPPTSLRTRIIVAGVYLLYAAVVLRTLANQSLGTRLPVYLGLELIYLVLCWLALRHPASRTPWKHAYFGFQSVLVLVLIMLRPRFDFILVLFVLLSLQSALLLRGRAVWMWVAILTLLTGIPLIVALGLLQGLSLTLMPMTIGIVFPAYVTVTQQIEAELIHTRALLDDLRETNERLAASSSQVEELSAMQERNRLARQLHDSVSQTIFSISLHTRASQILLERDPEHLRPQLELLQSLTHDALGEMRGLIAELRPRHKESAGQPTPQDLEPSSLRTN
jgi:signal transduction histidine kinase